MATMNYLVNDHFIAEFYNSGQHWEEDLLEFLQHMLDGTKNVVDVGAHVGSHTMVYAKRAKFVYAYEPQRVLYRLLLLTCLDNDVYNVVPTCAAISYQSGQAHLSTRITDGLNTDQPVSYNDGVPRNYGGVQLGTDGESVPQLALPALEDVALLKVDVEGFEPCVFYGARDLIRASRPVILFERNWKFMDPEVQSTLGIPDEVAGFSVEEFAAEIGYGPVVPLDYPAGNLLLAYDYPCLSDIEGEWRASAGGGSAVIRRGADNVVGAVIDGRGPFRIISVGPSTIVLLLALQVPTLVYNGTYVYGEVEGNTIYWANSTQWDR